MQDYPWISELIAPVIYIFGSCYAGMILLTMAGARAPVTIGFRTREEYLEARRSMNLEDFLDRAYMTPESIKRETRNDFHFLAGGSGSDGGNIDGFVGSGAGGVRQAGGSASSLTDILCASVAENLQKQPALTHATQLDTTTSMGSGLHPAEIKGGTWLRNMATKELAVVLVESVNGAPFLIGKKYGTVRSDLSEYELASPMVGEFWYQYECAGHGIHGGPRQIVTVTAMDIASAQCGCLWPLNYGKGY